MEQTEWITYAKSLGIYGPMAVLAYYLLPKLWSVVQAKFSISGQQNDLAQAGLSGVTEVISTLRGQIADMTGQLDGFRKRLAEMDDTLQKALSDRIVAEQAAAQARTDLFNARLYISRLAAQIKSLGAVPADE